MNIPIKPEKAIPRNANPKPATKQMTIEISPSFRCISSRGVKISLKFVLNLLVRYINITPTIQKRSTIDQCLTTEAMSSAHALPI
jgi:hypothetical protein